MKKIILIALAFVALQVTAQQQKNVNGNVNHKKSHAFAQFTPEEVATIKTKKMTLFLDLDSSQQREIQKINLEKATDRKAHIEAKKESGLNNTLSKEDRVARINKMLDYKIATKAKMKQILNAEQYAKWEKAQSRMTQKHKGKDKRKWGEAERKRQM